MLAQQPFHLQAAAKITRFSDKHSAHSWFYYRKGICPGPASLYMQQTTMHLRNLVCIAFYDMMQISPGNKLGQKSFPFLINLSFVYLLQLARLLGGTKKHVNQS